MSLSWISLVSTITKHYRKFHLFFRNWCVDGIDEVIKSLVDYHHWTPNEINEMYCDDFDFKGLIYWYDELVRINKKNKV